MSTVPSISLCMIVRNEQDRIARAIKSVSHLVYDVVVVDTGSTDDTFAVARDLGARVFTINGTAYTDFAAWRNKAIMHATGDWILMLDADEWLSDPDCSIRMLIKQTDVDGYWIKRRNNWGYCESLDYLVRLFRRDPRFRFVGRVHETIHQSMDPDRLWMEPAIFNHRPILIEHDQLRDPAEHRDKHLRYIGILNEEINSADNPDPARLRFLAAEYHQMGDFVQAGEIAKRIAELLPRDEVAQKKAEEYDRILTKGR